MKELERRGQQHVLKYYNALSEEEKTELRREIDEIDWGVLDSLKKPEECGGEISPIQALTISEIGKRRTEFYEAGKEAIRSGKLAAVLLAGGQGTRLGSDAPKGAFNIGATRPLYIFELLIKNLLSVTEECGAFPPFLVMTSEKNDSFTRQFLEAHDFFGYPREKVRFFQQKTAPCVDFSGKLLLEEKGRIARSPNGNGGWYSSLLEADIMREFPEVEWFNVFSVDNVLQKIADPVFLGATILSGTNCGAKGVLKSYPEEKVGVLCLRDGLPGVIEYYDLPKELAQLRDEMGRLVYSFGVTLNYLFRASELEKVAQNPLPVHVVKKKIPYLNEDGDITLPEAENGYKFETLILDLVRLMGGCLPFEIVREKEFAPVKNRTGVDSVDSARELLRLNGISL